MKTPEFAISLAASLFLTATSHALTPAEDNFNSARLKKSMWTLKGYAKGRLAPAKKAIQFTVSGQPTGDDFGLLTLKDNRPGYDENWEIILDVVNKAGSGYKVGTGILVSNAADPKDNVGLEFYGLGPKGGFNTIGVTDDRDNPSLDLGVNPGVRNGSMRITYDKASKTFTFWYDANGRSGGYVWTRISSFSTTGKGGDRRGDWKMNPDSGSFTVQLFGYSDGQSKRRESQF